MKRSLVIAVWSIELERVLSLGLLERLEINGLTVLKLYTLSHFDFLVKVIFMCFEPSVSSNSTQFSLTCDTNPSSLKLSASHATFSVPEYRGVKV